jgi:hypothetical protein
LSCYPKEDGSGVDVVVNPTSDRLQLLTPFEVGQCSLTK